MYFVVAVPKNNFEKMKNTSQFITFFFPSLIPPCCEMGRFECCTTKHEQVEILAGSIAPCPRRAFQYSYNPHTKIHLFHQYSFIIFPCI